MPTRQQEFYTDLVAESRTSRIELPEVEASTTNYIMVGCKLAVRDHASRAVIDLHSLYCCDSGPTKYNNQQTEQIELKIVADFQEASSNSVVAVAFQGCLTKRLGSGTGGAGGQGGRGRGAEANKQMPQDTGSTL
uniref:Uncharacterized protein n=1 Tax=Glossina pallidipes TaxID=7398 RepID=A0A1A9ZI62_GLOPL